ncbi:MAG TPA: ABC transporter ATP-binding protein, partial [Actinomycetota bacterium]
MSGERDRRRGAMTATALQEEETRVVLDDEDLPIPPHLQGAWAVLRHGLRESPALRRGLALTVVVSIAAAGSNLIAPVLLQQIFDHGFDGGFRPGFVFGMCALSAAIVTIAYVAARAAARRLVRASEEALTDLRVRGFEHIHRLSIAAQTQERRGVFVARVTADVDTLSRFTEWSGIAWIVSFVQIVGALALMLVYSWQLTIPVVLLVFPLLGVVASLQGSLSAAYDAVRVRVGEMLSEVSESVMGADVVRAYGLEEQVDRQVKRSIRARYDAQVLAHRRTATLFPLATVFWGLSLSVVIFFGATFGPEWGLTFGKVSAFLFLADMFVHTFTDLPEIYADTQTAIAGWRKILALLWLPVDIVEPSPGESLPPGPLSVRADDVSYRYGAGTPFVLHDVSLEVPAGAHVAVVGETGSGKTTFCKLLVRLADPTTGAIEIERRPLREIGRTSRQEAIRMVPQDGFLFDLTVRENVRAGREGASDREIEAAIDELGLSDWVRTLQHGLDTRVGERGEALSVGERQLVSLARAQIGNPGLLILDEATSAVDPATERRISEALRRLSAGRTTITIAHRLSTAEGADAIFVFDGGRVVERGRHRDLVHAGGT